MWGGENYFNFLEKHAWKMDVARILRMLMSASKC